MGCRHRGSVLGSVGCCCFDLGWVGLGWAGFSGVMLGDMYIEWCWVVLLYRCGQEDLDEAC